MISCIVLIYFLNIFVKIVNEFIEHPLYVGTRATKLYNTVVIDNEATQSELVRCHWQKKYNT